MLGSKRLSELGRTLTHEHLALDFRKFYTPPPKHLKRFLDDCPSLQNIGYIRQYPYSSLYNLEFYDGDAAKAVYKDVELFKEAGGGTIVENSSHGLKRDISLMTNVSRSLGVNVIAGTGYYVASTQNATTLSMTKEGIYNLMREELEEGCTEYPDIKAGFIGEVGSTWPIEDFEKRVICATGELQAQLRCSVSFHPGRDVSAPMEIMRIYQEAGGDASRAIMSHIDRTLIKKEHLMEFADATKCYIQFDLFGTECSYYQLNPSVDMLSDAQRIKRIVRLKEEEKLNRVLMSHDIHTKHRLIHFGGHGYSHIANNIVPTMINKGFTMKDIELITVENPKRWLTRK
ncbi:PREDICTED: phosphotriesterase-related protein isoform X2 [Vollenhovia emeryi]|uniref:phosphotriesterase-related protein isoform X2 n=1 Tax=Vollenhovia emeryi TaxID=411798 RepID=UPI0005F412BE|nr:PREDICTED: phosphotriesterase-related protein isoform X2 [Vollenhovia emeryi]